MIRTWFPPLGLLCLACLCAPTNGSAQGVLDRTPNLSGGWVSTPGALHFNFNHRFWTAGGKLVNSPTFHLALPLPGRSLVGLQYASNSLLDQDEFNEWEVMARWALLSQERREGVQAAITGAWNPAMGSGDGEFSMVVPLHPVRLLASARAFSNLLGSGEPGWSAGGGVLLPLRQGVTLAGDAGTLWTDGGRERRAVWGAGLQLHIPTTPHTFSVQVANTRTATLQGSAVPNRTFWGFEFTVPVTFARYFSRARPAASSPEGRPATALLADGEVEITMTDDMRYLPDTVRIRAGQAVVWRNTTPVVHTVTAHPERVRDPAQVALPAGADPFDSGNMFSGDTFRHTFTEPGEYVYICVPHDAAGMIGVVIVER